MSRVAYKDKSEEQKKAIQATLKRYHKTKTGFLSRLYKNMRGRVEGIQKLKSHLYYGLELLPREDFYSWALSSSDFLAMFIAWTDSGYDQKLTPTVDRVDSSLAYTKDNIRWLTHSENSRNGAFSRWKRQS